MIGNFRKYISERDLDVDKLKELKHALPGDSLIHLQVNKLFDENESELEPYIQYFRKLYDLGLFTNQEIL